MFVQKSQRLVVALFTLGIVLVSLSPMALAAKKEKNSSKSRQTDVVVTTNGDAKSAVTSQVALISKCIAEGNATKLSALWTSDGTYTDEDGVFLKGKAALEKRFSQNASENGKQPVTFIQAPVQMLADTVALAEGVVWRNEGVGSKPQTRYSIIFVKQDGNWLISNATETPLVASVENVNPLTDLAWLIGEWATERDGKSVKMKAEWAADKKFIQCKYETKISPDAPVTESRQLIGWDPRINQPVSWHFDSSGGFGHGDWSRDKSQWVVQAVGVDREGNTTTATDLISALTPDSFSWQSVNRSVDGVEYNDSAPLKVVRVAK
ncbi:hypothetical protein BH10CYA1_BH10CYA1_47680 [soil metagenome]